MQRHIRIQHRYEDKVKSLKMKNIFPLSKAKMRNSDLKPICAFAKKTKKTKEAVGLKSNQLNPL